MAATITDEILRFLSFGCLGCQKTAETAELFIFSAVSDSRDSRAFYFPLFFLLADSRIFIQRLKKTAVPNGLLKIICALKKKECSILRKSPLKIYGYRIHAHNSIN